MSPAKPFAALDDVYHYLDPSVKARLVLVIIRADAGHLFELDGFFAKFTTFVDGMPYINGNNHIIISLPRRELSAHMCNMLVSLGCNTQILFLHCTHPSSLP